MKGEISLELFNSLDLRVGVVVEAERIPNTRKLLKLKVDIGDEVREIVVGGAEYYDPSYFIGKHFIVLVNLKPKKIAGVESRGMLLAADVNNKPVWLTVDSPVPPGSRVR
ncbi:MAG: tRNA-binding protein [Candidatus Nezhaarchaeota archaeon]|nr:tRNA-binding protein [Candidatus Nezhaarchaeota archaeon]MCX8141506.1 tRNA-binding protein [Candidatus Nezhaarchaeota archaeon]MDW8049773.1 tRNA-binding protein [Nitrososphaerota archaeon]